jgi:hypothetical protein
VDEGRITPLLLSHHSSSWRSYLRSGCVEPEGRVNINYTLPAPENVYVAAGNYVRAGAYKVFVRVVGSPGGSGTLSTCAVDELGTEICSVDIVPLAKSSKFSDVTRQLTTVQYDFDDDSVLERIDIFDPMFEGYLWAYDNNGLKNVQLRFYPIAA